MRSPPAMGRRDLTSPSNPVPVSKPVSTLPLALSRMRRKAGVEPNARKAPPTYTSPSTRGAIALIVPLNPLETMKEAMSAASSSSLLLQDPNVSRADKAGIAVIRNMQSPSISRFGGPGPVLDHRDGF